MTENLKKFLEAVSKDEALKAELGALVKSETEKTPKTFIDFAASKGFILTVDDFKPEAGELSQDELKAVAGGTDCGVEHAMNGDGTPDNCGLMQYFMNNAPYHM